ncbi:prephenate dehydratase [Romeria aff. gracilis LEGE 07310]|uniref:Prephenate dehydratase n=1 Tax=Vasconcelosia minhoensis LEGE 07310 TaxID=915328 RepID=A0A8J7ACV0_9CYAN|nr:prephenate dehydratase [Romeria gracilis]MBE9077831.1 prephenate dehydratase [Romeria aff. gracilis LEGE 07310]
MNLSIAYLGPQGTYSEFAASTYARWLQQHHQTDTARQAYPSIAQVLRAVAQAEVDICVVPVENSIGGGVTTTLDMLWELDMLQIQRALTLPIEHAFLSQADRLQVVSTVYSHPQALTQCQKWLETHLPEVTLIATNSTTEALQHLDADPTVGAISSAWAAQIYGLPVLAHPINDHSDNCTRFWVLSRESSQSGDYTSLAFSLPTNDAGALLKPLQHLALAKINMSRIESRPTKRSLGDYLFFIDIEAGLDSPHTRAALDAMGGCTETLKLFGSYTLLPMEEVLAQTSTPKYL